MLKWIKEVDRILRGEATRPSALRDASIPIPAFGVTAVVVVLGLIYGFFMGWFALFNRESPEYQQLLASTVKVPALFLLTLIVTFPSLYVFNALVGSQLKLRALLRLLAAAMAVMLAVLASFGPITAFFSVSTESYSFMILLNVALFGVAGLLGLGFLLQTLHRLSVVARALPPLPSPGDHPVTTNPGTPEAPESNNASPADPEGALDPLEGHVLGSHVKTVFRFWIVIFALVGGQMSWVLRPFVGNPSQPFEWFRERQSNFFEALWNHVTSLFS